MTEFLDTKLDRTLLVISDEVLQERMARVTPLIFRDGELHTFDIPDLRNTAFTWEPKNLVKATHPYTEAAVTKTQHSCGYYGFFKPSIAEVLAQLPDDPTITAFYLDSSDVVVLWDGEGHLAPCHWLRG